MIGQHKNCIKYILIHVDRLIAQTVFDYYLIIFKNTCNFLNSLPGWKVSRLSRMWDSCLYSFRRLQNSLSTLASFTQTGIWQTTQLLSSKLWQQSLKRYMKYKVKLFTVHHRHRLCALVCFGLGFFWLLSLKWTTAWMIENVLSFHKLHAEHNYPKYILQSLYTVTHKRMFT